MKRVATGVILAALTLGVAFFAPDWAFILAVGLAACLAAYEFLVIADKHAPTYKYLTVGFIALGFAIFCLLQRNDENLSHPLLMLGVAAAVAYFASLLCIGMRKSDLTLALPSAALSFFSVFYIAVPLLLLVIIRFLPAGRFFLLYLFAAVWSGDVAAYYVGKTWGRHKMAPRISPNKSWEGAAASVLFSLAVTLTILSFSTPIVHYLENDALSVKPAYLEFALFSILLNVSAQLGDLVESMIKRGAGVKDSGNLLPGHGGILDRIDALLFAAPIAVLLFTLATRTLLEKAA
jgi:phosphatidate cytidylyltransferase